MLGDPIIRFVGLFVIFFIAYVVQSASVRWRALARAVMVGCLILPGLALVWYFTLWITARL